MAETLVALDRRAQTAEQRVTDLRTRYEFDRLRAIVTGRAMASEVAALIEEAIRNSGMEKAVYERFAPQIARLERDIDETKLDRRFVADLAGEEFVKRQLPARSWSNWSLAQGALRTPAARHQELAPGLREFPVHGNGPTPPVTLEGPEGCKSLV
ncbi:MAG TPA: hypothetical protein VEA99_08035 [Gemmatimonadaceae bacterium]|nr:hypothetical protein [Gemmatimonadaceae bacterium]